MCTRPLQDALRMSVRTQSQFFDGLQDNWFHFGCFWKRVKGKTIEFAQIRGVDYLKWDDQVCFWYLLEAYSHFILGENTSETLRREG